MAKVFDIARSDVRSVLKQAGITIRKKNEPITNNLADIGMTERDFYRE